MPALDVFRGDAFNLFEMTDSINRAVYSPGRLSDLGLFEKKGIRTTHFGLERKGRKISLLTSKARGSKGDQYSKGGRAVYNVPVPHIPYDDQVLADEVQNIRSFGSETELQTVAEVVNEHLDDMRQDHEVTHEYHRIGAIKGIVLDGDGTTELLDLFDLFGISQTAVDFVLGTAGTDVKAKVETVRRAIENALGALVYTRLHAFCGDTFWDKLVSHANVKEAYDRWQDGSFLRDTQRSVPGGTGGFEYAGVFWENYRGKVGDVDFIPAADCRFVPIGVKGLFLERWAPADFIETVNTTGLPVYASQEPLAHNRGISIHTQSNPLMLCTIPDVLVRGHTSN